MMLPKPARRGPKARKPIARSRTPIARRRTRRSRVPAELRAKRAATLEAKKLWAFLVKWDRGPVCQWYGIPAPDGDAHHMVFQSRSKAVRFDLENGAWLSRAAHQAVHSHHEANERLARAMLSAEQWDALKQRAMSDLPEAPADAVARLRAEVRARGLVAAAREAGVWKERDSE